MDIFYCHIPEGNFGDDLNKWFWDNVFPNWKDIAPDVTLIGIGTIIHKKNLEQFAGRRILSLGSGAVYGKAPDFPLDKKWDFRLLRGEHSADVLRLDKSIGVTDPATMVSEFSQFKNIITQNKPIFIPHIGSIGLVDWENHCAEAGIKFVNPRGRPENVIRQIAEAPLVLAESMHAAIIADTFRVPWIPVHISGYFNHEKWRDFFPSTNRNIDIPSLYEGYNLWPSKISSLSLRKISSKLNQRKLTEITSTCLENALHREPHLSSDNTLQNLKERYQNSLIRAISDYS